MTNDIPRNDHPAKLIDDDLDKLVSELLLLEFAFFQLPKWARGPQITQLFLMHWLKKTEDAFVGRWERMAQSFDIPHRHYPRAHMMLIEAFAQLQKGYRPALFALPEEPTPHPANRNQRERSYVSAEAHAAAILERAHDFAMHKKRSADRIANALFESGLEGGKKTDSKIEQGIRREGVTGWTVIKWLEACREESHPETQQYRNALARMRNVDVALGDHAAVDKHLNDELARLRSFVAARYGWALEASDNATAERMLRQFCRRIGYDATMMNREDIEKSLGVAFPE